MKILSQQQNNSINNQPNFKGVNLVHIPKSAFQSDNMLMAGREFGETVRSAFGIKPKSKIVKLLNVAKILLGMKTKQPKLLGIPKEGYLYPEILNRFQTLKNKGLVDSNCDLNWAGRTLNIPINESSDKTSYSFYLLTGEHAKLIMDNVVKKLGSIALSISPELQSKFKLGKVGYALPDSQFFIRDLLLNREINQRLNPIIQSAPVKEFRIDNLTQMPEIVKQFAQ